MPIFESTMSASLRKRCRAIPVASEALNKGRVNMLKKRVSCCVLMI